jgi:hypothetical protein
MRREIRISPTFLTQGRGGGSRPEVFISNLNLYLLSWLVLVLLRQFPSPGVYLGYRCIKHAV